MKQVTETVLTHIMAAHPNTQVIERGGKRIAQIPIYDFENDLPGVVEKEVSAEPHQTPMGILPVFNIRTGPKFNPEGDPKVSPLGHLYRIMGYSPGKKGGE